MCTIFYLLFACLLLHGHYDHYDQCVEANKEFEFEFEYFMRVFGSRSNYDFQGHHERFLIEYIFFSFSP